MMIIVKNARFKKILIVCLAILIVSGAVGAYFRIFKNPDNNIISSPYKTVNADKTVIRKAQFILLPSKRLILGSPVEEQNQDLGYAQSVKFDPNDMLAMDNDVFYYLDLNGTRILTFKTFADPDDYKNYRCIAIETSYPIENKSEEKNKIITPMPRIDFEGGKDPVPNVNGLIQNYYTSCVVWIKTAEENKNIILSAKEIKYGKIIYNCILTTLDDNGNPEGGVDLKTNKLYGKYYTSYEEILKARTWKNPENFKKYFNNEIIFPHLEDFQWDAAEVKPDTGSKAET